MFYFSVIFDIIYFAALALGFLIHNSPLWTAISLVVLGFIVNYMRRFGLDNSMAPMIAWVLCFLATILPITDAMSPWVLGLGILVGFLVSGIVGIFIFPENYPHLFVSNSNRFFQNLAKGIHGMRQHVLVDNRATDFINLPFMSSKVTLDQLLESNQAIQSSTVFTKDQKIISHVLMHQYALLNAYFLMSDVYYSLSSHQIKLPRSATRALSHLNKEFAHLFSTIRVGADYSVYRDKPHYVLSTFSDKLGRISLTEPVAIMALLNFKLSFDMLNQHVAELLRGYNDA